MSLRFGSISLHDKQVKDIDINLLIGFIGQLSFSVLALSNAVKTQ